jgi:hypothetical protein
VNLPERLPVPRRIMMQRHIQPGKCGRRFEGLEVPACDPMDLVKRKGMQLPAGDEVSGQLRLSGKSGDERRFAGAVGTKRRRIVGDRGQTALSQIANAKRAKSDAARGSAGALEQTLSEIALEFVIKIENPEELVQSPPSALDVSKGWWQPSLDRASEGRPLDQSHGSLCSGDSRVQNGNR